MDDIVITILFALKEKLRNLELDIVRAHHGNLYDLGRLQGRADGFNEVISFVEASMKDQLEDE